ncbi:hypothetical protein LCGC14_0424610 [marine sediment metagenome]|uniref:Uncharacterized protein n=1 Tax=marine sediment metagenome TaxID=412755 RepID=A0A0F9SVX2_9ZZZZ
MVFVRVNGYTLDIEHGSVQLSYLDIGERKRSFSGKMLTDRRARKRIWSMRTIPLEEEEAKLVEGLVAGLGDVYRPGWLKFDKDFGDEDFNTVKGKIAQIVNPGGIRWGIAADRAPVVDSSQEPESQFGLTALEPEAFIGASYTNEATVTNILQANTRDGTENGTTGGWAIVGAGSLFSDLANKLQGLRSLRVSPTAAGDGVETGGVTATALTTYTASVYVKPSLAGQTFRIEIFETGLVSIGFTDYTNLAVGVWQRIHTTQATSVAGLSILFRVTTPAIGIPLTYHVDAAQLEVDAGLSTSAPTTWANPTRTLGSGLQQLNWVLGYSDVTVNFWFKAFTTEPSGTRRFFRIQDGGSDDNILSIQRELFTDKINFQTIAAPFGAAPVQDDLTVVVAGGGFVGFDGTWHMLTCVMRQDPEGAQSKKRIYLDGVALASSNPSALPDFRELVVDVTDGSLPDIQTIIGGQSSGSKMDEAQIQDMMVLPFAASDQLVSDWFNVLGAAGVPMSPLPRVYLDGDIMPDRPFGVLVDGEIADELFLSATANNTTGFRSNLRRLSLRFQEV